MVGNLLQECYSQLTYSPPLHYENVLDIIEDAINLRNAVILNINKHNKIEGYKEKKTFFNEQIAAFYEGIIELTERLNSLEY